MAAGGGDLDMQYEFAADGDEEDDDDSEGWNEMDAETESHIVCLFCKQSFKTMAVALEHCKLEHKFHLTGLKTRFNMDCYSYICLINYVRKEGISAESIMESSEPPWLKDEYLAPVVQDDPWLMFDFEGLESPLQSEAVTPDCPDSKYHVVNSENGLITLTEQHFAQLQFTIQSLSSRLQNAVDQIEKMKLVTQKLVTGGEEQVIQDSMAKMRLAHDSGYFRSYSHYGIHHEMLSDAMRMKSYHDAISKNTDMLKGKTVLDVGCGTAILSMFAASAGAYKVYGVDPSDIIYHAMEIVRENNVEKKVELIKGTVETISLPCGRVDIIMSEWMGYLLLFEGMLDSVINARDKLLRPGGLLLPNRCAIFLVGISDQKNYNEMLGFWSDVHGFTMKCMAREVLKEAVVCTVTAESVATTAAPVLQLDLYTCDIASTIFCSDFTLEALTDGTLTSLAGYFDVYFDLPQAATLSTSPNCPTTHWKQTVFYLPKPIPIKQGESISGQFSCKRPSDDTRALTLTISIAGQTNTYELS